MPALLIDACGAHERASLILPLTDDVRTHAGALSETEFNPTADLGLNSIYVRH